jgi:hypothetical protein
MRFILPETAGLGRNIVMKEQLNEAGVVVATSKQVLLLYMYICIYVNMYICIYVYIYICMLHLPIKPTPSILLIPIKPTYTY